MTLTRRDAAATVLTALVVLVFAAARESWNVWLVGSSHRSAAGAILLLGMATCTLGASGEQGGRDASIWLLSALGAGSLAFAVWAIWTGSFAALTLLTASTVLLWAAATLRHALHAPHRPISI